MLTPFNIEFSFRSLNSRRRSYLVVGVIEHTVHHHHHPPSHVDVVVGCELQVDRLDARQSQDGDVDVDQERISSPGAGTQLVGINLRNLQKLIFHSNSFMACFEKLSLNITINQKKNM